MIFDNDDLNLFFILIILVVFSYVIVKDFSSPGYNPALNGNPPSFFGRGF